VRNLRFYGQVEIDLLQQGQPQALVLTEQVVAHIKQLAVRGHAAGTAGGIGGSSSGGGGGAGSRRARGNGQPVLGDGVEGIVAMGDAH
jgi:hypothetical protein